MFGKKASGERLERMKNSPHYKDGKFHNINHTPAITEGYNYFGILYEFLLKKIDGRKPGIIIPSIKTDLTNLPIEKDVLIWFGHSSYFIQIDGKRILVDPVFSGNASPLHLPSLVLIRHLKELIFTRLMIYLLLIICLLHMIIMIIQTTKPF